MKRNLAAPFIDLDGKPYFKVGADGHLSDQVQTLQDALFSVLNTPLQDDAQLTSDVRTKLFKVAQRVHAGGIADFSADEIALLKARTEKVFNLIAWGCLCDQLERDYVEPAPTAENVPSAS